MFNVTESCVELCVYACTCTARSGCFLFTMDGSQVQDDDTETNAKNCQFKSVYNSRRKKKMRERVGMKTIAQHRFRAESRGGDESIEMVAVG